MESPEEPWKVSHDFGDPKYVDIMNQIQVSDHPTWALPESSFS